MELKMKIGEQQQVLSWILSVASHPPLVHSLTNTYG
jgi:hypothetical protein